MNLPERDRNWRCWCNRRRCHSQREAEISVPLYRTHLQRKTEKVAERYPGDAISTGRKNIKFSVGGGELHLKHLFIWFLSFHSKHVEMEVFLNISVTVFFRKVFKCNVSLHYVMVECVFVRGVLPKPRGCPPIRTILHSSPDELVNRRSAGKLQRS